MEGTTKGAAVVSVDARHGAWRWMIASGLAAILTCASLLVANFGLGAGAPSAGASASSASGPIAELAAQHPGREIEVIVQLRPGVDLSTGESLVSAAGATSSRELPIINGLGTRLPAEEAQRLSLNPAVRAVSLNAPVASQGSLPVDPAFAKTVDPSSFGTSYNQSIRSPKVWDDKQTGKGIGVAVIDSGIAGSLPDVQTSPTNPASRVIATAVVNPGATNAGDSLGHGTHVAGLIAGNSMNRPVGDPLRGKYVGVAPEANLIAVKAGDENGEATVLDIIDGLQFVVDHKADYNIRVVNLSLKSTQPESYKTDPLDAAVEAAWNSGIVVVAAAGNSGLDKDAVSYAPANDPFVITVGGVDDKGTKDINDDALASWSSRGVTQDGFEKPDILAPGAKLVSTISPNAQYKGLCPTCIVDNEYFRIGGTSMAAAVASGEAALMIGADPTMTPDDVKTVMIRRTRPVTESETSGVLVDASGNPVPARDDDRKKTTVGAEAAADKAVDKDTKKNINYGVTPNTLLDPVTGLIDYSRTSWSRTSWSEAPPELQASWSRTSWSRTSWSRTSWSATPQSCADFERTSWSRTSWSSDDIASAQAQCSSLLSQIDPTRTSWSRTSWSLTSWSTSFTK